nr:protein ACCELERATED CELL DEATH 6-like [Ipomoea batatas]
MKREIYLCDMTDDSGWTPLHYAIKNQYSETARMILAERSCSAYICVGKDCWIMLKCKSQNVLHETVLRHSLNAIDYILKYPQIDNLIAGKDEDGKTPVAFLLSSCRDLGTILWNVLLCRGWRRRRTLETHNRSELVESGFGNRRRAAMAMEEIEESKIVQSVIELEKGVKEVGEGQTGEGL